MKNIVSIISALILAAIIIAFKGSFTITGIVTDMQGKPLAGVTVVVKGSGSGVLTDNGGKYRISTDRLSGALLFSLTGFATAEEKILNRTIINIKMKPETVFLNEDKATAQGISRERASKSYDMAEPMMAVAGRNQSFQPGAGSFNTEGYAAISENGYKNVKSNPLSTFSIDVDNASYSNIRRFINMGVMPPPDL